MSCTRFEAYRKKMICEWQKTDVVQAGSPPVLARVNDVNL